MEAFLTAASFVGLPGALNGIIGLCERVISLVEMATCDYKEETQRLLNIKYILRRLEETEKEMTEDDKIGYTFCTKFVGNKLRKIEKKLSGKARRLYVKSIQKHLDRIDQCFSSFSVVLPISSPHSAPTVATTGSNEYVTSYLANRDLLQRLLDTKNKNLVRKSTLKTKGVYTEDPDGLIPKNQRRVSLEGDLYFVERIALGSTERETEKRLSRLGLLILIMQESREQRNMLKMTKIVREENDFCILSKVEDSYSILEELLPNIGAEQAVRVLLKIAEAVANLHDMMIVHEALNSCNILIDLNKLDTKLMGFVASRMVQEQSDRERPVTEDPLFEKRKLTFQSPERIAGSRYTFECDIYSLGVVMAEVWIGRALTPDPSIHSRSDILNVLDHESSKVNPNVVSLIKDCIRPEMASERPPITEVVARLNRLL